jgi:hypothetical protein
MREEIWQALDELFSRSPILKAEPVPPSEIAAAEAEIGFVLSPDYKDFIARYGGAIVGPFRIFGLRRAISMGKNEGSFVEITNIFRGQHWPGIDKLAVISMDHGGNPVCLDASGKIWISDHDVGGIQSIADDFEEYLRKCCLKK